MGVRLICSNWCSYENKYRREFVCDTDTDFADLPESATGSTAVSIESGNIRMVNTSGEWVPFAEG